MYNCERGRVMSEKHFNFACLPASYVDRDGRHYKLAITRQGGRIRVYDPYVSPEPISNSRTSYGTLILAILIVCFACAYLLDYLLPIGR